MAKDAKSTRRGRRVVESEATTMEIRGLVDDANEDQPKRRSVKLKKDDNLEVETEDEPVDDSRERELRKKEIEESNKKASLAKKTPASTQNNFTNDEWEAHFSRCIQLCNKNKVNTKNAFKLKIIDYMQIILTNKSKTDNLALMSCTLDASAKIYSFRVDKVYADVLKVVSGKEWDKEDDSDGNASGSDKEEEIDNNDNDEIEESAKGKKKKQEKKLDEDDLDLEKFIAKDKRQIDKNENEKNEGESVIKDRSTLPDGLEYFLELPINEDCEILLNGPVFPPSIDRSKEKDAFIKIGPRWCGNEVSLDPCDYLPQYKELHKSFHMIGEGDENVAVDKALMFVDDVPKIIENVPMDDDDDMREEPEYCGDYDDHLIADDEPDEVSSLPIPLPEQTPSVHMSSIQPSFSVQAMSNLVSASRNEYSFFDSTKVQFWKPPSHWSIKKKLFKNQDKREHKKPTKMTGMIDFNVQDVTEFDKALTDKENPKLLRKTLATWSANKMEPYNLHFSSNKIFCLDSNEGLFFLDKDYNFVGASVEEEKKFQVPVIEDCERMDAENDDDDNDRDAFMPEDEPLSPLAVPLADPFEPVEEPPSESHIPQENNELIAAPEKVAHIAITYAKIQKKLDMKLLKATMWKLLNFVPTETSRQTNKETKFSEVFYKLMFDLPKEDAKALSFPIAYMALLHLSNEKSLFLEKEENDIIVRLALKPQLSS